MIKMSCMQSNRRYLEHQPPIQVAARVESLLGRKSNRWQRVERGHSGAECWVTSFHRGSSVFVKFPRNQASAHRLLQELNIYTTVCASFMPILIASERDPFPVLILEDLTEADWPPPWSEQAVERVVETLSQIAMTLPPAGLDSLPSKRNMLNGWTRVAANPKPFLSLGLCSHAWLKNALPSFLQAEQAASLDGNDFLHLDVRSDNICFAGDRTLLVDWDRASYGNGQLDVVAWLPSLYYEGGPVPEGILKNGADLLCLMAGYWASLAGRPPPEAESHVRQLQLKQLEVAFPWAASLLELPPPAARN